MMNDNSLIDITFDFRSDTPTQKDPDTWSPTLCKYHKLLWSKVLPGGEVLDLVYSTAPFYLHHCSALGEFCLSSDTVIPDFRKRAIKEVPDDLKTFGGLRYTIGGMMLFPANQINGQFTINQERGCRKKISDRFDLTLECIRRHYFGGDSPLDAVLARYSDFFRLFRDFLGYVEFFLLQDLVTDDCEAVRFFTPFDDFKSSAVPSGLTSYLDYRTAAINFLRARNERMRHWSERALR